MNLDTTKHKPVVGATDVVDRHDMGMVEAGDDSRFGQVSLDILGAGNPLGAWAL